MNQCSNTEVNANDVTTDTNTMTSCVLCVTDVAALKSDASPPLKLTSSVWRKSLRRGGECLVEGGLVGGGGVVMSVTEHRSLYGVAARTSGSASVAALLPHMADTIVQTHVTSSNT